MGSDADPARLTRGREAAALAAIVALGAALRFHSLGRESIWIDEAFSIRLASVPLGGIVAATGLDGHPPLYLFLLHGWMGLFGTSEAAVRSLSAALGVAALPVIHLLGRRLFGVAGGLVAALLLAVNSYHIYYSQEARNYALLVLTTLLSWAAYERDGARRTRASGALYVAATVLMLYTHVYAGMVLLAQLGHGVYTRLHDRADAASWRRFVVLNGVIAVCLLPWLGAPWTQLLRRQSDPRLTALKLARPTTAAIGTSFYQFAGSAPVVCVLGAAAALALFRGLRTGAPVTVGLLLWLLLPHAVPFAYSQFSVPVYITRSTIVSLPAFCLLAASALAALRGPARIALVAACALAAAWYQAGYFQVTTKEQWREAAANVSEWAQPGEVVAFDVAYGRTGFAHYLRRQDLRLVDLPGDVRTKEAAAVVAAAPSERVWLVRFHRPADPEGVTEAMKPAFTVVGWRRYVGIDLFLLRRALPPPP
jgi:mannosyltransferase